MRVDFHSHFLPGIDDGAQRPEQSLGILRYLKANGIDDVCATPHYSLRHESIETFLSRREASCRKLYDHLEKEGVSQNEIPRIHLGAEVALFHGLCDREELKKLSFGDGNLLIELQFAPLRGWETEEVFNIMYHHGIRLIMAHINRYTKLFHSVSFEELFLNGDVVPQINCEITSDFFVFSKMKKIIKSGLPVVFGCDLHSADAVSKSGLDKMKKYLDSLSSDFGSELNEREKTYLEI